MKKILFLLLVVGLMISVAACGQQSEEPVAESPSNENQSENEELSGTVIIDGSGTVYPLMAHIAEEYMTTEQPEVSVQVDSPATVNTKYRHCLTGRIHPEISHYQFYLTHSLMLSTQLIVVCCQKPYCPRQIADAVKL
mgnify:CR=1 FL=1